MAWVYALVYENILTYQTGTSHIRNMSITFFDYQKKL